MKYIRTLARELREQLGKKPIIILYGARQVGKTTLLKDVLKDFPKSLYLQGDDPKDVLLLEGRSRSELYSLCIGHDIVVIDEAQRVENIGTVLKLIADSETGVPVIATGSSAFELAQKISEPLTGRNRKLHLYPLSLCEVVESYGERVVEQTLDEFMLYGMYPAVVAVKGVAEKKRTVSELANDYLFKDVFLFGDIRNAFAFQKLVRLLAVRTGSEISYAELAKEVGINKDTVINYITLLEQAFIVFRLPPLYTNKTTEINKHQKLYFWDVGIRNALIGDTDPLELRSDKGALFENFFIAEMMKQRAYSSRETEAHFWQSRQVGEVDFVEVDNAGKDIRAYKCKWNAEVDAPGAFTSMYPFAHFICVTRANVLQVFR